MNKSKFIFVAATFAACSLPGAAFAHAELVKSDPVADGTLAASAQEITFTFNESVTPVTCKLTQDGKEVESLGKPRADGMMLHIPILKALAGGRYALGCRVVGPDSHPINETISFVVPAAGAK
ncbi:MAG: copper resistance protein CopC [Proteobacteria bacterium]|nr:copper resistance protein CopC [Pseudomonadota bacterium]